MTQTVLETPQAARGKSLSPPRGPTSRWTRLAIMVAGQSACVRLMAGAQAAEHVEREHPDPIGGVGIDHATSAHGPFVHIDVRGTRARWGAM